MVRVILGIACQRASSCMWPANPNQITPEHLECPHVLLSYFLTQSYTSNLRLTLISIRIYQTDNPAHNKEKQFNSLVESSYHISDCSNLL